MKMKKIMITVSLVLSVILASSLPAFAQDNVTNEVKQKKNNIEGDLQLDDPNVQISKPLTFDEMAEILAKDNQITKSEASKKLINSFDKNKTRSISPYSATYRTLTTTLYVTSGYKPTLKYYCQTEESGGFRAIKKVLHVGMNRSYGGISKAFNGQIYTYLEDPNRIKYTVNGDFYHYGTTTTGVGLDLNVGEAATINLNASRQSDWWKYFYKEGYFYF